MTAAVSIICNFLFIYFICVTSQIIRNDKLCSHQDVDDKNILAKGFIEVIRLQSLQIQELFERLRAQEALTKNMSEFIYSKQIQEINEKDDYNGSVSGQFGQEFILSFPQLKGQVSDIMLLLVSQRNVTVTITSQVPGVNRNVSVSPSAGASLNLPTTLVKAGSYVGNNTVSLHSNDDVAAFVLQTGSTGTGDGYVAIPRNRLKKKYFFSMNNNAVISIVSFADDTLITLSNSIGSNVDLRTLGSSFKDQITLRNQEVLQLWLTSYVIGTVEGSKPFMILHGSSSESFFTQHPTSYIDSIVDSEGYLFIIPYLSDVSYSVTFCNVHQSAVALSDVTVYNRSNYVFMRNFLKTTYIKIDINTTCHYVGHGFSVTIPSVQSYTTYCRFLTPRNYEYTHHAVVMIQAKFREGIKLWKIGGEILITSLRVESIDLEATTYVAIFYNIEKGQYEIFHELNDVYFGVITYGFGKNMSIAYGYPACFK